MKIQLRKIMSTFYFSLVQLFRDRNAIIFLFLMPVILVLIVSLIQNDLFKFTDEKIKIKIILIDDDSGTIGETIEKVMKETDIFEIIECKDMEKGKRMVRKGYSRCLIYIPDGSTELMNKKSFLMAKDTFSKKDEFKNREYPPVELRFFFDPVVRGAFRHSITETMERLLLRIEIDKRMKSIAKVVPRSKFRWVDDRLFSIKKESPFKNEQIIPNAVQQNIPAWSLFGMFFIVIPLSSMLIRERDNNLTQRLLTMPVSYFNLLSGKILAYTGICLIQFILMILVGIFLLPLFGVSPLNLGNNFGGLILMAVSSALAATGYGIMIGSFSKSLEQATSLGPFSIMIAAVIGGIMVPSYIMPDFFSKIRIISPLAWGLDGFLKIFVRNDSILAILPHAGLLLGFFILTMFIASFSITKRD